MPYPTIRIEDKNWEMKARKRKYEEILPVDFLLLREKLGIRRYRKNVKRDEEERKILLDLGLKKIEEKEKDNFISTGYRKRKVKIISVYFFSPSPHLPISPSPHLPIFLSRPLHHLISPSPYSPSFHPTSTQSLAFLDSFAGHGDEDDRDGIFHLDLS